MTTATKPAAATISCETTLFKIGEWTIIKLPVEASSQLPSRGMTLVEGSVNGFPFKTPLEPDGRGSHWLRFTPAMHQATGVDAGARVRVTLAPATDWPEPAIPDDLQAALAVNPAVRALWRSITPMARWDWLRWIGATKQPATRQRHIEVALSKLSNGARRPCCFNRSLCTEPYVSHNGLLLEPVELRA